MEERNYYVTPEVCLALDISHPTAVRLGERGEIPGMYRVGSRYRWKKTEFDDYMRQKGDQGKSTKRTSRTPRTKRTRRTK